MAFAATMALFHVFVSFFITARAGQSITSGRSLVAVSANPIRRVVTMLEKMAKKIEAEGEEEEALYEKFNCYCSTSGGDLQKSIAEATAKVPQVSSDIEAAESELAQLQQDLKTHQEDRSAAKAAIEAATAQREKEFATFSETSAEYKSYIDSLGKAIPAIQSGMAGGGFLQTAAASKLLQRAVADASSVTDYDRQMVAVFLAGKTSEAYVPQSQEIVGILEQIKEDYEKSLAEVEATEAEAVKLHDELMVAKQKQVIALTESIESKTLRIGELQVEIVHMKNDLSDTQAALLEDQKFAADLTENCEKKAAEWDARKKMRAEELLAIRETIKVLNDDEALDLFKKTLPSPSLLQVAGASHQMQLRALAIVQGARRASAHPVSLDFLALALSGKKVDFSKVLSMIDEMVELLGKEQQDDDHKKEYCDQQIDFAEDKGKDLTKKVADLETLIADKEELISTVSAEIKALTEGVAELDKSVSEATEQRVKEHKEYEELIASNSAAKELLAYAKNRLNKFYNPALYVTTPAPELSREDQIYTSMGGTLPPTPAPGGIAGTGVEFPASFVQIAVHSNAQRAAPPLAPETWDAYSKKGGESAGVIGMIDLLVKDLDKEMTEAEVDEKNAQTEYEKMTSDAADKRAADMKSIAEKEAAKGDAEMDKAGAAENRDAESKELMATKEYEYQLHQECDWLIQNFEIRKEARAGEVESLKQAKAILAGADFSFAQKRKLLRGK